MQLFSFLVCAATLSPQRPFSAFWDALAALLVRQGAASTIFKGILELMAYTVYVLWHIYIFLNFNYEKI